MDDQTFNKWAWIWGALAVIAIGISVYFYLHPKVTTTTITKAAYKTVPQIQTVTDVQRIYVPVKQVVALDKHEVAQKLDMPWLESSTPAAKPEAAPADQVAAGDALPAVPAADPPPAEPAPVAGDPTDMQVIATGDIPETDNGAEAVTVLNTKTGLSSIVLKEKTAPWFELESGLVAGLRYGLNTSGQQTGTAYVGWEFLRVKDFHLLTYGEINTDVAGKIQIDLQYRR